MFNSANSCYSLSDIAAATGKNDNNGWGGDGSWWIVILFLLAFSGGWGGYGFGGGVGGRGATTTREEIAYGFDNNNLENGIRGIQQGLCDGFYSTGTSLLTGFDRVTNNTNQGFAGLNNAICQSTSAIQGELNDINIANMQGVNLLQNAISDNTVAGMQNTNALTAQINALSVAQQNCC